MKTRYKIALFVIIAALLIFLLTQINFGEVWANFKKANLLFALVSFILLSFSYITWSYRWYLLLPKKVNFFAVHPILMAGIFLSTITPGARVGGEPLRAYLLSRRCGGSKTGYLATIMLEKVFTTLIFLLLILISLLFVVFFIKIPATAKIIIEIVLVLFLIFGISGYVFRAEIKKIKFYKLLHTIYQFPLFNFIRRKFKTYAKFEIAVFNKLGKFMKVFKQGITDKRTAFQQIGLSIAIWLLRFLSAYFIFLSLGFKINFFLVIVVLTLTYLVGDFSFVPGGIGFMEVVMISLYSSMAVPLAIATIVSLLTRVFDYINTLIMGGICFTVLNWRYK